MEGSTYARTEAQRNWDRARQGAVLQEISSVFTRRSVDLLSFDEVRHRLRLTQKNYRGLQDIPLDQIRGSVGRYRDFTRTFMPRNPSIGERWRRVSTVALDQGLPPIDVYQVGETYFVLDGNHRVSIARQNGSETIQAHVWEFLTPVGGLSADADMDEVFIKQEYAEFLERTSLDRLRPEQAIVFTEPGRYRDLEYQIAMYQRAIEKIDEEPCSWEDAVTAWYDMIYEPSIQIIKESGVLEKFPDRTESDLFVWVWKYHKHLEREGVKSLAVAADDIGRKAEESFLNRIWQSVVNLLHQGEG
jgi:uncharacterized ParB-like nuclease family protein